MHVASCMCACIFRRMQCLGDALAGTMALTLATQLRLGLGGTTPTGIRKSKMAGPNFDVLILTDKSKREDRFAVLGRARDLTS